MKIEKSKNHEKCLDFNGAISVGGKMNTHKWIHTGGKPLSLIVFGKPTIAIMNWKRAEKNVQKGNKVQIEKGNKSPKRIWKKLMWHKIRQFQRLWL